VKRPALDVLIVEGEEPVTEALSSTLARRGHRVFAVRSTEKALALPAPDVFVCEGHLPGSCGFELLSAVRAREDGARFVLLLGEPTVEDCLRAFRLGASDLLAKPFRVEDLVRAVEAGPKRSVARSRPSKSTSPSGDAFERAYPPIERSVELCARELCAFALVRGVPPSVRARIACAAEEIVQNAVRHARLEAASTIRVHAKTKGLEFQLEIADDGAGFDPERARGSRSARRATGAKSSARSRAQGPARTGLERARALSEHLDLRTAPGSGTLVALRFSTSGASLCASGKDLSEIDFLAPDEIELLIGELLEGRTPEIEALSPAVAVVIGRLLAGAGNSPVESDSSIP
jgi:ActR/RegA family two-component response regulator